MVETTENKSNTAPAQEAANESTLAYEVGVEKSLCKDCGYCQEVCRQEVFQQSDSFNAQGYRPMVAAAQERCIGCLKCFMICPEFAISVQKR